MKHLLTLCLTLLLGVTFSADKLWTCIKEDGSTAFQMEAKYVYDFSDGLSKIKISLVENNKWVSYFGFVNTDGEMVIPAIYDDVKGSGFINDRAWVKKKDDSFWTLIDKTGKVLSSGKYDAVGYIFENNYGLLAVYKNDMLGFIDLDGKEIVPCQYLGSTSFNKGLACVTPYNSEKGYGFIDPTGKVTIPFQFKQAGTATFMDNGLCRATVGGKTVLIDTLGNVVFKTSKGNIQGMWKDWVRVFTKSDRSGWGYMDMQENWVIDPVYGDLQTFNEDGWAIAELNGLKGIIDTNSKVILPFKYETIYMEYEKDGFILAVYPTEEPQSLMNTPKDFFTADLQPLKLPQGVTYIYPADGQQLTRYETTDKKKGYMNRQFEVVIPAKYSKADSFNDGRAWVLE